MVTLSGVLSTYPVPPSPPTPKTFPSFPSAVNTTDDDQSTTSSGPTETSSGADSKSSSTMTADESQSQSQTQSQGEGSSGLSSSKRYPYFTTGDIASKKAVVFIGGLTNGLGDVPYLTRLGEELEKGGWKLVQMHWSGAYEGYGTGSLDRDVVEMRSLVKHLRENGDTHIVLMGHSTGSQDVMHYLTSSSSSLPADPDPNAKVHVQGGIMQAPASDHELYVKFDSQDPGWVEVIRESEEMMRQGRGHELMSDKSCAVVKMRMTGYRAWSLHASNGDDDYFSRHIPSNPDGKHSHPLSNTFGKLPVPALAIYSAKDEHIQLGPPAPLLARWQQVAKEHGKDLVTKVINGSHDLKEKEATEELARVVVDWVKRFE